MTSRLFSPITLADTTFENRIVVAPMCQYSAADGAATDWHLIHLGNLAQSGASLVVIEATGVEMRGRITPGCLALETDEHEAALARILPSVRRHGSAKIGIQLAHAGRKASAQVPWGGGGPLKPEEGPWQTVSASAVPFGDTWHTPAELDRAGLDAIIAAFAASARRSLRLGIDLVELHAAHGYLLHQFLSPISNHRTDAYGGSPEKRRRFPLEVAEALRAAWPKGKPLGARITANDWMEGGLGVEDAVIFASALKSIGYDFVCVSSGAISPAARMQIGPGYQVPFAARVREATGMAVRAVGLIADPHAAEAILAEGKADIIALARGMLDDPRWPWHAAEALGDKATYPLQYERARSTLWPGATLARPGKG